MAIRFGDLFAYAVGLVFPYAFFLSFRPPWNLRIEMSGASKAERWSVRWLKPTLLVSGLIMVGAVHVDRRDGPPWLFFTLLAAGFLAMAPTIPAGHLAFRTFYGWKKPRRF